MKSAMAGFIPSCTRGTRTFLPTTLNSSFSTIRYRILLLPSTVRRKDSRGWDSRAAPVRLASPGPTPCMARNARANASAEV
jgi:hypothetical protein